MYVQSMPWAYFSTAYSKTMLQKSWHGFYFQAVIVLTWYLAPAFASWLVLRVLKMRESDNRVRTKQRQFLALAIALLFLGPAFASACIQGAWHEKHFSFD
jgi:hypothetical protein